MPSTLRERGFAEGSERAFSPSERTALESLFDDYLVVGGFPAVQGDSASTRVEVLQGYVRDVVARDVAERLSRPSIALANQVALLIRPTPTGILPIFI